MIRLKKRFEHVQKKKGDSMPIKALDLKATEN